MFVNQIFTIYKNGIMRLPALRCVPAPEVLQCRHGMPTIDTQLDKQTFSNE